ncbi:hypothetical protein HPB50_021991 [Hyalomma asiaticum]|uniref:Uncharacterized protein n=1 Tax=Hyalomma asiaticum TaxID=266040 RepID=A0ACB7S785_HYAAI|nr:hypothetical protein HPB50_021991 [Hyalomma asiaticum]
MDWQVEGESLPPEAFSEASRWLTVVARRSRAKSAHAERVAAIPTGVKPDENVAAQGRRDRSSAKAKIIRGARMPPLPKEHRQAEGWSEHQKDGPDSCGRGHMERCWHRSGEAGLGHNLLEFSTKHHGRPGLAPAPASRGRGSQRSSGLIRSVAAAEWDPPRAHATRSQSKLGMPRPWLEGILHSEWLRQAIPSSPAPTHPRQGKHSSYKKKCRELLSLVDRNVEFIWHQSLSYLRAITPTKSAATSDQDVVLPDNVKRILSLGPKYAVAPTKAPHSGHASRASSS